jgi:hypothetical protein
VSLSARELLASKSAPSRPKTEGAEHAIAPIERLPKWLLCVPIGLQLFWLGAKYGSVTLPSVLNPVIENGGLVGESKFSYLHCVGTEFRHLLAQTTLVAPGEDIEAARARAAIAFPLIAKPDIGWCGYGVRRVEDVHALRAYAASVPPSASILVQQLATEPNEAGLHCVRAPHEDRGRVVALTIRHPPSVVGDGKRSIDELIEANPRTQGKAAFYRNLLSAAFRERRPESGETVVLTTVASTRIGGQYEDATYRLTPALSDTVDALCRSMGGFEYGRLDVRFDSIGELCKGRFKIIEINGAGSEAIQYWDPRLSMRAAFAGVFAKQRELYELANSARRLGRRPVGLAAILRAHFKQQALIRGYPPSN